MPDPRCIRSIHFSLLQRFILFWGQCVPYWATNVSPIKTRTQFFSGTVQNILYILFIPTCPRAVWSWTERRSGGCCRRPRRSAVAQRQRSWRRCCTCSSPALARRHSRGRLQAREMAVLASFSHKVVKKIVDIAAQWYSRSGWSEFQHSRLLSENYKKNPKRRSANVLILKSLIIKNI